MNKLIGISGKAGSGKDTVAAIVKAYLHGNGLKTKRYSFADPLKKGCVELFGVPLDEFYDRDLKEEVHPIWNITRREMLIMVGTDHLRDQFDEGIWIKRAKMTITTLLSDGYTVIIPDVRYDNELDFINDNNGVILHVHRDQPDVSGITHKSEAGVDTTKSIIIYNNSGLDDLNIKVNTIITDML